MNKFFGVGVVVVATALFSLAACDNTSKQKGKDGYYFEKESFTRTEFPVEVVLVKDAAAITAEIKKRNNIQGTVEPKNVAAFSVVRLNDPKCTIYMIDPKNKYEPEFIGHEFVHCIYGVWHSEPQK
jgi:predicted small secreted protein